MEGFAVAAITSIPTSTTTTRSSASLLSPLVFNDRRRAVARNLTRYRKPGKLLVFASKEEPRLEEWDQMELKFGKLLGEDPKLTMAKIMGKKANPDASYLEIEESFYRRKGKAVDVKEVPFEVSKKGQSTGSLDGLNLVRPVPKRGVKFQADDSQPVPSVVKKPAQANGKSVGSSVRSSVPNVILRKPTVINEDDVGDKPSTLRIKRNLSLSMRREPMKEKYSDMTLLRKPEPVSVVESKKPELASDTKSVSSEDVNVKIEAKEEDGQRVFNDFTLIQKPDATNLESMRADSEEHIISDLNDSSENVDVPNSNSEPNDEYRLHNSRDVETDYSIKFSAEASLQKKPQRLGEPAKETSYDPTGTAEVTSENPFDGFGNESLSATSEFEESEDADWMRAQDLVKTRGRGEVELLSSSTRGFVVSFGSLIGFLPYRNLTAKWKFLAFESWLRQKGLDPSKYKQNLGVIGRHEVAEKSNSDNGDQDPLLRDENIRGEILPNMQLEDLLRIYDQEKLKFLSSFVGQKVKVNVLVADRKFRKLIFSMRPKEKEELVEKKRSVMANLRVGDVVKCCIKKITYFGIFVEVEGVPALIHQTEVSWDATLDPMAFFKIGQIVEAKVHQLDFALERIFLSLKEITPDPLIEALESVVGDHSSLDGRLEAAEVETEWAEVESLIKELEQIEGVQNVTKGRFFLSPGLAPTFQVYMASMFENQYKLLARAGNRVQEVIVEASLDKEEMKSVILTCTNRVE
ncbi:uncharacterized protein LOC116188165 [Punica granatum]|uniref:S1 motif domain-containing protein n=2 Tax=Punica granatum TaxID=22663 RepID=A0A218WH62_PUNGR|nr:uncharacterized protein LOC116188165 [Punica granatum]OWM72016.1 hypothetical protein CDL15_Pgr017899 [Punica granatum]PKI65334.1 hypothetical protein CRG98_014298 [Punica granatum]